MKQKFLRIMLTVLFILIMLGGGRVYAQSDPQTGQSIYTKLEQGALTCNQVTSDQYKDLGAFYMQRIAGSSYSYMDQRMDTMMGSSNTDQMYIALGERLSGCNANAVYPSQVNNMMGYISNYGISMMDYNNRGFSGMGYMMQSVTGGNIFYEFLPGLFLIALLVAALLGLIYLYKQIMKKTFGPWKA